MKKKSLPKRKNVPLVSVIVPTLNEEKYVARTLRFLQNQLTPRDQYEIIVCDSSSNDRTVEIARPLADQLVICKRMGAGYGRNFGAKQARGKYLVFLDADTLVTPHYIDGVINGLKKYVCCSGPISSYDAKDPKSQFLYTWWDQQVRLSNLMGKPLFPGFNVAVRRKNFEKLGGFYNFNALSEDHDFSLRVAKMGKTGFIPEMAVSTSSRRLKESGIMFQVKITFDAILLKKYHTWNSYRKDFNEPVSTSKKAK